MTNLNDSLRAFGIAIALSGCGAGDTGTTTAADPAGAGGMTAGPTSAQVGTGGSGTVSTGSGGDGTGGAGGTLVAPAHFMTWDYYDNQYGANPTGDNGVAHAVSVDQAAAWLSWTDASASSLPKLQALGIKGYLYTMPTVMEPNSEFYAALVESDFAHDCSGSRLSSPAGYGDLTDPHSTHLLQQWQNYIDKKSANVKYDAVFEDAADGVHEVTGLPCNYDATEWHGALVTFAHSVHPGVMPNGLGPHYLGNGHFDMPWMLQYNTDSNIVGQRGEGCYTSPWNPSVDDKTYGELWQVEEDIELATAKDGKVWFCMAGFNSPVLDADTDHGRDVRLYVLASFLLTYDLQTSMLGMGFDTPSRFHVEPEAALVPLAPVVATPTTVDALLDPVSGVYVREYGACFLGTREVGPCAIVVNSDQTATRPFPKTTRTYAHTLRLTGGGVLDGSTATPDGDPPPDMLGPVTGAIAF